MKWDSNLYDNAQNYVSEHGRGLIDSIPKKDTLSCLDLGCGTGDLTHEIYQSVSKNIIGLDSSKEMIEQAKSKYPHINFDVCDATHIAFEKEFDIIFSNAVFHWINDQKLLHQRIYMALKDFGKLICEFGAQGNINNISNAFNIALQNFGSSYTSSFYFPSVEMHSKILEQAGFTIEEIYIFDRPTVLPNEFLGLRQWVCQFFSTHLEKFNTEQKEDILQNVETQLQSTMFDGKNWIADYRRLRVIAHI